MGQRASVSTFQETGDALNGAKFTLCRISTSPQFATMPTNVSMMGWTFGQRTDNPIPQFSGSLLVGGSSLYQSKNWGPSNSSDWRKDLRAVHCRDFIRNKIVEIFNWKTNHACENKTSRIACFLENQLYMDSTSMEEYMNLESLEYRLQVLLRNKMVPVKCGQQVAHCLQNLCLPSYMTRKNSGVIHHSFEQLKKSESCLTPAGYTDQGVLSEGAEGSCTVGTFRNELICSSAPSIEELSPLGCLDGGKVNMMGNIEFLGHKQNVHSVFFPPTTVDALGFSGLNLQSSGDNLQLVSDHSDILHCNFKTRSSSILPEPQQNLLGSKERRQWPHHISYEAEANDHTFEELVVADVAYKQHQQSFEELNSDPGLQFSVEQKILLAYVDYRRSQVPATDSQVSFIHFMHSEICSSDMCRCEVFLSLVSHFDVCQHADCDVCGPVHHLSVSSNDALSVENVKKSLIINFGDRDSCGTGSGSSENMQPPLKRSRTQNPFCSSSADVGISCLLAPLANQNCDFELPALWQLPESPSSIASDAIHVNTEMVSHPTDSSICTRVTENDATSNFHSSSAEVNHSKEALGSEEMHHAEEEMEFISVNDTTGSKMDNSFGFRLNMPSILSEELVHGCEGGEVKVNNMISSKFPESEMGISGIASESGSREDIKYDCKKRCGVSVIEFFTTEQIEEHLLSLRQEICQGKVYGTMNSCQLCGTDKLTLAPPPLYCSSCGACIKRGMIYYSRPEENGLRHCFCTKCYRDSRGGIIISYGIPVSKAKLEKKKNDEEIEEPWVQCDICEGWQHQICALFNDKRDMEGTAEYICPKCCLKEIQTGVYVPPHSIARFSAKDLPRTSLSDHIEQRLIRCLQEERETKAKDTGESLDAVPTAEGLVVRVVLSVDKHLKVKTQFLDILQGENYPVGFPFKSKVILLFQNIEGIDVCLFSMYVQEYGSECACPNQRCVYISYLDSVKYFRPDRKTVAGEALRTFVYHEILIGYLEHCKERGFATCYIWACPPLKGEDYILYCHPEVQKTPKQETLRHWYRSILQKATDTNIVVDFTNIYDCFFVPSGQCNSKVTAARLPYFDGDYWSDAAETFIKDIEQESEGDYRRKVTKRTLKAMGHKDPIGTNKDILLMHKLGQAILPVKEDFIIVRLQYACKGCNEVILSGCLWQCCQCKNFQLCERCNAAEENDRDQAHILNSGEKHLLSKIMVNVPPDTLDEDTILENSLFENRHAFMSFCQENQYQFDTLRRAKHSSMVILHYLHHPIQKTQRDICSVCRKDTAKQNSWICDVCPNFAVCAACYQRKGGSLHNHTLSWHSSSFGCLAKSEESKPQTSTVLKLQNLVLHASQCSMSPCSYPNCFELKKLFRHVSHCIVRARGGCEHCKKVWLAIQLHSRNCKEPDCHVPRCSDLKKHALVVEQYRIKCQS